MWLDDFIPSESPESWAKSAEISEKIKEWIKKWAAWVKRVKKDEKKAQKYDRILAWALAEIIKDEKYDFLLNSLFDSLSSWFNSSFLLWIISLIKIELSNHIRDVTWKQKVDFSYVKTYEFIDFDDDNLDASIKNRINNWIEDVITIVWFEYSSLQIQRLLDVCNDKNSLIIINEFTSKVFLFFFYEMNIKISEKKSLNYSDFILSQIFDKLKEIEIEEV